MEFFSSIDWNMHATASGILLAAALASGAVVWRSSLFELFAVLAEYVRRQHSPSELVQNIVLVSRLFPIRAPQLNKIISEFKHPFLKEAFLLVNEGLLDEKALDRILSSRISVHASLRQKHCTRVRILARVPAAFGLAATVWHMSQGQVPEAAAVVVQSLVISYLIFIPTAEWLSGKIEEERRIWTMIAQGAKLVVARVNPVALSEEMNSYLPAGQRVHWTYQSLPAGNKAS